MLSIREFTNLIKGDLISDISGKYIEVKDVCVLMRASWIKKYPPGNA